MKHRLKVFLCIFTSVILVGAIATTLSAFLILSPPHIPSLNEIRFRWKLTGPLDSPAQIRQLTTFAWERVCIKDDFDWLERPDKGNYILIFYQDSKPIEEFYLNKDKHSNLELHVDGCFNSEQKFFHRMEK